MEIQGKQINKMNIYKNTGRTMICVYLFHAFEVKYNDQLQVKQGGI